MFTWPMQRIFKVVYFSYRQARVMNWFIKVDRNARFCDLIETFLAWCVGRTKDNKVVYGVPMQYIYDDGDKEGRYLYFWFADDYMYVGTEAVLDGDPAYTHMDRHGIKWGELVGFDLPNNSERGEALEGFVALVALAIMVGLAVYLFVLPFINVAINFGDIIAGIY